MRRLCSIHLSCWVFQTFRIYQNRNVRFLPSINNFLPTSKHTKHHHRFRYGTGSQLKLRLYLFCPTNGWFCVHFFLDPFTPFVIHLRHNIWSRTLLDLASPWMKRKNWRTFFYMIWNKFRHKDFFVFVFSLFIIQVNVNHCF